MALKKSGRPKSENPKNFDITIRLTKEETDMIQECADKLQTSRTDVIIQGVKKLRSELEKK